MGQRRGFKITDSERKVRVGIAVEDLADLKRKTISKFKLCEQEAEIAFQRRDGIAITSNEELLNLPAQTLLIWVREGERAETDAEILYRTIREVNFDFLHTGEKVQEFFTEQMKNKVYMLAKVLKELDDDHANVSTKEGDPDWFEGIDSRSKTKEEYMFRRSQDRIRKYFYTTKDELLKYGHLCQNEVREFFASLSTELKAVNYFGHYFDRSREGAMCNTRGMFHCQGRWDKGECLYEDKHKINPYRSFQDRIVFQTWNLDHCIERSRSIIPGIVYALEQMHADRELKQLRLNLQLIFGDLFTHANVKLVHIVCHDKGAHDKIHLARYIETTTKIKSDINK